MVGTIDMTLGILTAIYPYLTLRWLYGYDTRFTNPDPTWNSYTYGYFNVLILASYSA